jgi:hypothetical protein
VQVEFETTVGRTTGIRCQPVSGRVRLDQRLEEAPLSANWVSFGRRQGSFGSPASRWPWSSIAAGEPLAVLGGSSLLSLSSFHG